MKEAQGGENRKESEPADKPLKTARELEISLLAILFLRHTSVIQLSKKQQK